ncbi:hypothetical protein SAMN06297251_1174 [Fulvimarina manganoxydans]|uniref:DUF1476 domain-containing protein n=1 Tax=Fulvimarina manganoxydans TaxID=937218 RepID=A0A1W2DQJ8_9HYPH|nr:DUF1476 domain-containing protein [Fulvimarina manganoxydans]MCK5932482.1 DUF1476 domain-containing protein [Fulvimarina manganoxydans]SMC99714.1 hypothetical protein SAMN06297251_1174 [Fulvimarina manganoxydans]
MMFNDRERDFENRYVHDQELKFRIRARRNKLLGQWAAEKLGKSPDEANAYAQAVIRADFELPGEDDVFAKLRHDFDAAGIEISDADIRAKMAESLIEAEKQVMAE